MAHHPLGIGTDQPPPHARREEHRFIAAPVIGQGDHIDTNRRAIIDQATKPVSIAVEPGHHQVGRLAQVQPTIFNAQKGAGPLNNAPKMSADKAFVAIPLFGLHHVDTGKVIVPVVVGDPLGVAWVVEFDVGQFLHIKFAPKLVRIGHKTSKDVDVKFIEKFLARAIIGRQHLDKLLLIEHTVERGAVDRLTVNRRQDTFAGIHALILHRDFDHHFFHWMGILYSNARHVPIIGHHDGKHPRRQQHKAARPLMDQRIFFGVILP